MLKEEGSFKMARPEVSRKSSDQKVHDYELQQKKKV